MPTRIHTLHVNFTGMSSHRSYPIIIGRDLLADAGFYEDMIGDRPVVLVSNDQVGPLYASQVHQGLGEARHVTDVILPDGEAFKNIDTLDGIFTAALKDRHERRSVFMALGGGVIGDMTGFAAACFMRGVDFLQLPTTLLAQVDSSVGGKTGVNHPVGKNMIGAFHQPLAVAIDINTLETLPEREFAAGMAEIIKYGCIYDAVFFDWLINVRSQLLARDPSVLAEAIKRSCAIKAEVVAQDEREGGLRAILNFGHTFGHAIEQVEGYGAWLHGEAVAVGMLIAAKISANRGCLDASTVTELEQFLLYFGLPVAAPKDMDAAVFLRAMRTDKKAMSGQIRYIVLSALGKASIVDDISANEMTAVIG